MGYLYKKIFDKEFIELTEIKKKDFLKAKESLKEDEFEKYYLKKEYDDYTKFYKKAYDVPPEEELDSYLLYKILIEQRKTRKSIESIRAFIVGVISLLLFAGLIALLNGAL